MAVKKSAKLFRRILKINNSRRVEAEVNKKTVNAFVGKLSTNESEDGSQFDAKKQIKYGTKYQAAWGLFSEYCDNSTIHGMKYLGEQKRPVIDRIFWIAVFILSTYICTMLIINVYNKWTYNPVIVSFAEKSTPVWEIPFPAVTICKERKSDRMVFNFDKTINKLSDSDNLTSEEAYYLEVITQICTNYDFEDTIGNRFANASQLVKAMEEAMWDRSPCYRIAWRKNQSDCARFRRVLTEEGICYSFNNLELKDIYRDEALIDDMILKDEYEYENIPYEERQSIVNPTVQWNLENGYSSEASTNTFPYRVLRSGANGGLFLVLSDEYEKHRRCDARIPGFKIVLHTPGEIPRVSEQYIPIPFNQIVLISINPEVITTDKGLTHYDPMRRNCYFQNERYLRYFKVYTQSNCRLECLSNFTMKYCGCVKFSMPRTVDTPVCGAAKIDCMHLAEDGLSEKEFSQSLKKTTDSNSVATSCNCLPDCTSISYKAEVSQGSTEYKKPKYDEYENSEVSIFFKETQFISSKRSELYGRTDFLANCGGLLGLFMGVSALSIVELVYFCTVRLLTNLRLRRRKRLELKRLRHEEGVVMETNLAENYTHY